MLNITHTKILSFRMVLDLVPVNVNYLTTPLRRDVTLQATSHYSDVFEGPGLDEGTLHRLDVFVQ